MRHQVPRLSFWASLTLSLLFSSAFLSSQAATPTFVQVNSAVPQSSSVANVVVPFTAAQAAGDLNVVVVGWNDTVAQVTNVSDAAGNLYAMAAGPTPGNAMSQSIYYAKSIVGSAAGANQVTVTFSPAAAFPDVRILEYSGIDTVNAVDVNVSAAGNGTSTNSGSATTTNATDLLVGANMVSTTTTSAGSGFTSRVITNPDGDIVEDRVVTAAGSYSATAPMSPSGAWVMQMVAFRAAGGSTPVDTTPPTAPSNLKATAVNASQIALSWTASTDNVGVTAYLIERCQTSGCSNFAQIATSNGTATTFTNTGLTTSTTYSYRVRATDAAGNLSQYSNTATATTTATPPPVHSPTFVQVASGVPQSSSVESMVVTFAAAQTAGDLNVVIVGWNDATSTVSSVTDTSGNQYTLAAGPISASGLSQAIYYAKNIAGAAKGANQVTVVFAAAAAFPDVRIVEYAGIDPVNAMDNNATGAGSSATSTSGSVLTSNATDLLVGANTVATTTTGPGSGYTSRTITNPNGDIVEDQVVTAVGTYSATAPLRPAGAWIMQMVAFRAAGSPPPGPDVTPPTVAIASPTNGATVVGFVSVTANAGDNIGVAGVQFKADGTNIGAEVTSPPYTISWDTSALTPGTAHMLSAVARDAAGNMATSSVNVTVQSTNGMGQWQGPFSWPMVAVNMNLMPNGKVLVFDGQTLGSFTQVWNPANNTFTPVTAPNNLFCSGNTGLPDGRVFVAGGHIDAHVGLNTATIFNPQSQTWTLGPAMANGRWYPTTIPLPDGRIIVLSGESTCDGCDVTLPQIYNSVTNAWSTVNASLSFPYYPHAFVLPDGRVLVGSTTEAPIVSQVLNLSTQTWSAVGSTAVDGGTSVMYRPGKILKAGTSVNPDTAVRQSFATTYVLDMTQASPAWQTVASMAFPRTYGTMVLLPDGNVFMEGGGRTTAATDLSGAVFQGEIWSPTTQKWTTVASMVTPRLYHSTALLMPDGRVLVAGGGRFNGPSEPTDQPSAEYYLPPYFFKGARPTITSAPSTIQFGQTISVQTPDAAQIGSVVLMRLGSVTHNFNMSQNYVPLTFQVVSGGLNAQAPANGNTAPPGYYMLFIVNTNGVPSVAAIVNVSAGTGSAQSPPSTTDQVGSSETPARLPRRVRPQK
jgi:Galactose oxidase-like, Early set domain/Bacterial Ig domain/Fibronectin type III domain/Kelch motif